MGRKNRRSRTEYRSRLGFNPRKYTQPNAIAPYPAMNTDKPVPCSPHRGDIWFADLGCHPGTSVQGGCRPVIIISNNIGNANAGTFNVLPMTRHLKKPKLPCHTVIEATSVTDLRQHLDDSMLLAEQITTIGASQLRSYAGRVENTELLTRIAKAISAQLGLGGIHGVVTEITDILTVTDHREENETI